ncbi:hypothetical protein EVAR_8183_1 [Eumeta japonica]|uniref:Uncharacterized protein n=1 Tax=Eumeta variegata TaxID=151549 RepID=A0A4C1TGI9_EUMVA|nr:hypothetical protein EVAR_8183_1 [Eumeta japonica]
MQMTRGPSTQRTYRVVYRRTRTSIPDGARQVSLGIELIIYNKKRKRYQRVGPARVNAGVVKSGAIYADAPLTQQLCRLCDDTPRDYPHCPASGAAVHPQRYYLAATESHSALSRSRGTNYRRTH